MQRKETYQSFGDLVVSSEFCHRKIAVPNVLEVVDICSEVLFRGSVEAFGLSISFRVKGSAESGIDLEAGAKVSPEAGNELGPTIGDDVGVRRGWKLCATRPADGSAANSVDRQRGSLYWNLTFLCIPFHT